MMMLFNGGAYGMHQTHCKIPSKPSSVRLVQSSDSIALAPYCFFHQSLHLLLSPTWPRLGRRRTPNKSCVKGRVSICFGPGLDLNFF